eukprot:1161778-Pelagomonas_calceolata.AAC.3
MGRMKGPQKSQGHAVLILPDDCLNINNSAHATMFYIAAGKCSFESNRAATYTPAAASEPILICTAFAYKQPVATHTHSAGKLAHSPQFADEGMLSTKTIPPHGGLCAEVASAGAGVSLSTRRACKLPLWTHSIYSPSPQPVSV